MHNPKQVHHSQDNNKKGKTLISLLDAFFNSYSIILFSNSRWLGLILLLATLNTPFVGLCGVIGVMIAIIFARLLKFTTWNDSSGYYSFNSLLVTLASAYFYPSLHINYPFFITILVLTSIVTVILSVALSNYLRQHFALPALSIAFVLVAVCICLIYTRITGTTLLIQSPHLLLNWSPHLSRWFTLYFKSMGSIFFQTNIIGGMLIAVVILLQSRLAFLLSIIGFAVGYVFLFTTASFSDLDIMLAGFNIILTTIVIGGVFFVPSIVSFIIAGISSVAGALIGISIQSALRSFGIPPLALPFNLTVLGILYAFRMRIKNSNPYLLDCYAGSPEQNLEYYYSRIKRFFGDGRLQFFLPFNGEWTVTQGVNQEPTHKSHWQNAWDFEVIDENGKNFKNFGTGLKDYYCFDKPVLAPADGTVVKIIDWIEDNPIGHMNVHNNWGNVVVIQHAPGIYSLLAHLKNKSVQVTEGKIVKAGDHIAQCGNSGRSLVPHLHFHIQTSTEPGSPTIKTNLIYYINKNNVLPSFIRFNTPQKDDKIMSLHPESKLQEMLQLKVDDEYLFDVTDATGKNFQERWKINIDLFSNMFIESNKGANALFNIYHGVFNMISFKGKTNTALYALSLALPCFPYSDEPKLFWKDCPPIYSGLPFFIKPIEEFFSFITRPLSLCGHYLAEHKQEGYITINGNIKLALSKLTLSVWKTNCCFHPDKGITELELLFQNKPKLKAKRIE